MQCLVQICILLTAEACQVKVAWSNTDDPHGLTAYTSPTTSQPMGVLLNLNRTFILVIDINKLLAAPRTGSHTVQASYDLVANGVVTFVSVH